MDSAAQRNCHAYKSQVRSDLTHYGCVNSTLRFTSIDQLKIKVVNAKRVNTKPIKSIQLISRGTFAPSCTISAAENRVAPNKANSTENVQADAFNAGVVVNANELHPTNQNPMIASTKGYRQLIFAPQSWQRPRRRNQLRTGTLSQGRIEWPQDGQRLAGRSKLPPRGKR